MIMNKTKSGIIFILFCEVYELSGFVIKFKSVNRERIFDFQAMMLP